MTSEKTKQKLIIYLNLTQDFLEGRKSPVEFQRLYLRKFKDDKAEKWGNRTFNIINNLFLSAEAYCDDEGMRSEVIGAIDAPQLRKEVQAQVLKLQKLLPND